jgi:DNA-binding NarL/FixJ family response regulator
VTSRARVVLADDHPVVLAGLRNLIADDLNIELVGEAATGVEALKLIREKKPDLAILDISMPDMSGISLARRLRGELPSVQVLLLTLHEDRAYLNQALDIGVRGYVLKRAAAESLTQAIRAVFAGGLYIDPAVADQVFDRRKRAGVQVRTDRCPPTDRETEVLKLSAQGFTNKEIACRLDVGVKSVETYKARGAEKLGLTTRAEIVRYAADQGWLGSI